MEFSGENGTKPSTQARKYVYQILAKALIADLDNDSRWLYEGLDEADQRRVRTAVRKVIVEMRRKSGLLGCNP